MTARRGDARRSVARARMRTRNTLDALRGPGTTLFRWLRPADDHGAISLGPPGTTLPDLPVHQVTVGDGIRLGDHVLVLLGPGGRLAIGDGAVIDRNVTITCEDLVEIGPGVTIGAGTTISDSWAHGDVGMSPTRDRGASPHIPAPPTQPVVVCAAARIGVRAVLLPGARVAAGTVVPPATTIDDRGTWT